MLYMQDEGNQPRLHLFNAYIINEKSKKSKVERLFLLVSLETKNVALFILPDLLCVFFLSVTTYQIL